MTWLIFAIFGVFIVVYFIFVWAPREMKSYKKEKATNLSARRRAADRARINRIKRMQ